MTQIGSGVVTWAATCQPQRRLPSRCSGPRRTAEPGTARTARPAPVRWLCAEPKLAFHRDLPDRAAAPAGSAFAAEEAEDDSHDRLRTLRTAGIGWGHRLRLLTPA